MSEASQRSAEDRWSAVDSFVCNTLVGAGATAPNYGEDEALRQAVKVSTAAGLPEIQVSAAQGKMLHLLARSIRAERILEIGTLGGYSAIWLARALPSAGRMISLEFSPRHAVVARGNLERAGVADRVEVIVGRAIDSLPGLAQHAPFDLTFIDADKQGTTDYVRWALKLSRPGSLIIVDNVIRGGDVIDPTSTEENVLGMRRFYEYVRTEPRLSATALQTVGVKGYDGFAIMLVNAP